MWLKLAAWGTVWIISYITPRNYMIYLELKSLLYNNFGCETLGNGVS